MGVLLLVGCAKQGYPPGGLEDKTGPQIVSSYPEPGAVRVPPEVRPWIQLDEYPNRNTLSHQVFISPEPEGGYEVKVKGRRVEIRFHDQIPLNRTVVVTFSTSLSDLNGNKMSEPYVMAFSTGEAIDQGKITGNIAGMEDPSSIWIWAYPLSEFPDPDPREIKAPFATQSDQTGYYELSYLHPEKYRIFAVRDLRSDRLWDSSKEPIGFAPYDAQADSTHPPRVNLMIRICDLDPPKLRIAETPHRQLIRLSFNEPVDVSDLKITKSEEDHPALAVISAYQNPADSTAVLLTTAIQRSESTYHLRLDGIKDRAALRVDSIICELQGSSEIDTIGARLSYSDPAAGQKNVQQSAKITLGFSEAITLVDLPAAAHLYAADSSSVLGKWNYHGTGIGIFIPDDTLKSNSHYRFEIVGDSLRDIFGNTSPDSLTVLDFTTLNAENLGSMSGTVQGGAADMRLVIEELGKSQQGSEVSLQKNGQFQVKDLLEGKYRLWLYRDQDRNQEYSPGSFQPFTFAEPFTLSSDTVRIRSRWETEGVSLQWESEP